MRSPLLTALILTTMNVVACKSMPAPNRAEELAPLRKMVADRERPCALEPREADRELCHIYGFIGFVAFLYNKEFVEADDLVARFGFKPETQRTMAAQAIVVATDCGVAKAILDYAVQKHEAFDASLTAEVCQ